MKEPLPTLKEFTAILDRVVARTLEIGKGDTSQVKHLAAAIIEAQACYSVALSRVEGTDKALPVLVSLYNESVCCIGCGRHAPAQHADDCPVAPIVGVPPSRKASLPHSGTGGTEG